jgi:hypothetical protein
MAARAHHLLKSFDVSSYCETDEVAAVELASSGNDAEGRAVASAIAERVDVCVRPF